MKRPAANGVVAKTPTKPLSYFPEAGPTSHAETPNRPQSEAPIRVYKASASKRPRTSEASNSKASDSKRSVEIRPLKAN